MINKLTRIHLDMESSSLGGCRLKLEWSRVESSGCTSPQCLVFFPRMFVNHLWLVMITIAWHKPKEINNNKKI